MIGVPDLRTGQAVKLFVVKRDPALTKADLDSIPARLGWSATNGRTSSNFATNLPKSNIGKILRKELH